MNSISRSGEMEGLLLELDKEVEQLLNLTREIGSYNDTPTLRRSIKIQRDRANELNGNIHEMLTQWNKSASPKERIDVKAMFARYHGVRSHLREACNVSMQREARAVPWKDESHHRSGYHSDEEKQVLMPIPVATEEEIRERNKRMMELHGDVHDLSEILSDLHGTVNDQSRELDVIEQNTQEAQEQSQAAVGELGQASKHSSFRLPLLGALVGGILMGPVGVGLGMKGAAALGMMGAGVGVGAVTGKGIQSAQKSAVDNELEQNQQERGGGVEKGKGKRKKNSGWRSTKLKHR